MKSFPAMAAYLAALCYIIAGLSFFMMPTGEQVAKTEFGGFLEVIAQNKVPMVLQMWMFALASMFSIAVVLHLTHCLGKSHEIYIQWSGLLGIIGHAVIMTMSYSSQVYVPQLAEAYLQADASARTAIEAINVGFNDWMGFSLVGIWYVVIHLTGLRHQKFKPAYAMFGVIIGIAYFIAGKGLMLEIELMTSIAAGLGGIILGPVWFVWTGILIMRNQICTGGS